jgi:GT2 family glycosyltransferase
LSYPQLELLVIDNAPSNTATEQLIQSKYPKVKYVKEPIPGLDWARNRAIAESRGEIIAYTDDDVIVDPGWVTALVQPFIEDPSVMAVTGLVVPLELETKSQILFEVYGGFSRGFRRRWYRVDQRRGYRWEYRGTGQFGTGANMAYRRSLFQLIGPFDPALDVGTVTNGGGDLEMFFRVLKKGYTLVYEPSAIVRHQHRLTYEGLRTQIANNGVALYAFFVKAAKAYPEERWAFLRLGLWWFSYWLLRRLLLSFWRPEIFPRDLILAELNGVFPGLGRYQKAAKVAKLLADSSQVPLPTEPATLPHPALRSDKELYATAIRTVDLCQPLSAIADVDAYALAWVLVMQSTRTLGHIAILNAHRPITSSHLRDVIVDELAYQLMNADDMAESGMTSQIYGRYLPSLQRRFIRTHSDPKPLAHTLPSDIPVSILLGTYDRPDDLARCLRSLCNQRTQRPVEIIVVDNHPVSGLTAPVVGQFPGVRLITEWRQGVAYARNAGIRASQGKIIVTTDDDIYAPPDWLETLIAPLAQNEVVAVTGNVLPVEMETVSQLLFEKYGGLGRGYQRKKVDGGWFEWFRLQAVPTWELGGTANAAFRASIFHQADIGLMDEALGPGMPSGVGEDTYLFYKILKAGRTIVYEPSAIIWHRHRRSLRSLYRQIYNYSKGHVAYHLTTFYRDGDWRGLFQIGIQLPLWHLRRLMQWLKGNSSHKLLMILIEIAGNLAGPWGLLRSLWRVRREGRDGFRTTTKKELATQGHTERIEAG